MSNKEWCSQLRIWADLFANREKELDPDNREFRDARRIVELAIEKSCLLDRMVHHGEKPSETPCPVHEGSWSGIKLGYPGQFWFGMGGPNTKTPVEYSEHLLEDIRNGCRCFLHGCSCTTGWQPDEASGTLHLLEAWEEENAELLAELENDDE